MNPAELPPLTANPHMMRQAEAARQLRMPAATPIANEVLRQLMMKHAPVVPSEYQPAPSWITGRRG